MIHMTYMIEALRKVAQRLAEAEKNTFEFKQLINAELEKQKKAFPWMFSHEVLRLESPPPGAVSVVTPPEELYDIPTYTTAAYGSEKLYWSVPADEITSWETTRDITDEEVRGYCYGNGYWINIQAPKTLKELDDGTHIIEDEYGNVYTMKPTWNCISLTVKGDENND
jgi:hypothetical protein